ncbi:MAG: hypothetical protein B6D65_05215 [candidate division Zixibacteria bacterium 4484_93]|nr:MAG: hypothetical protein B6D65_05215 [candidate division Zixibacteria bacterium 4484_93]
MRKLFLVLAILFLFSCGKQKLPTGPTEYVNLVFPDDKATVVTTQVWLDWSNFPGAVFYEVELWQADSLVLVHRETGSSWRVDRFLPPGRYRWRVGASTGGDTVSVLSDVWEFELVQYPYEITSCSSVTGIPQKSFISPPYLFLAEGEGGVAIFDISEPISPVAVAEFSTIDRAMSCFADIGTSSLVVADYRGNLLLYGITDIENPVYLYQAFSRQATDVAGGYIRDTLFLFVADRDDGVLCFDLSEPGFLVQRGEVFTLPGYTNGVFLLDTLLFVAENEVGLYILDVSNPGLPRIVSHIDTYNEAEDVAVQDGVAYVADGTGGVGVVDVSDPEHPSFLFRLDTEEGYVREVAVSERYLFSASGSEGVLIFDSTSLVGQVLTPYAYGVSLLGDTLFIADRDWGLVVAVPAD